MMNRWWTAGLVWCAKDYHRLPLADWFYSIEHSKLSPGMGWDGYIPDSTNYKSTASGANNTSTAAPTMSFFSFAAIAGAHSTMVIWFSCKCRVGAQWHSHQCTLHTYSFAFYVDLFHCWMGWAGLYLDKSVCPDWHSASFSFHRMSDDLSEKIRNQSCLGQSELLLQNTFVVTPKQFVKHLNISRLLQIFQPLPGVSNTFLWSILLVWVISVILRPEIFIRILWHPPGVQTWTAHQVGKRARVNISKTKPGFSGRTRSLQAEVSPGKQPRYAIAVASDTLH